MKNLIAFVVCCFSIATLFSQEQKAKIKIEKTENGQTTIIEQEIDIEEGQDFNEILQELGVLDSFGNVKEGQSFEINIVKKDGLDSTDDITIEYFEMPQLNFLSETKAFLGVMLAEHDGEGVRISSIIEGTKAEEAGLLPGDILMSINGITYETVGDFVRELGSHEPGETILITYLRNNQEEEKEVELGEKATSSFENEFFFSPEMLEFPDMDMDMEGLNIFEFSPEDSQAFMWEEDSEQEEKAFLGVSPGYNCTDETKGVPIGNITEDSAAEKMGMQEGDMVQSINGEDMNSFSDISSMIKSLNPGDEVKITVMRDGKKEKLKGELGVKKHSSSNFFRTDPFDGNNFEFDIQIDGNEFLGENLEDMLQELENLNLDQLNEEEIELQIQEMLEPMLQNLGQITESISIGIVILEITEEDLNNVNENAQVELKKADDLEMDFINYFPNPLTGTLNLSFNLADEAPYQVYIYDQSGRTVFEDMRAITGEYSNTIDLSGLASGQYFLQIVQADKTFGRKIIKE